MKLLRHLLIGLFAIAIAACAPGQKQLVKPVGTATYPPSNNVEVLSSPPEKPYVEIGEVDASGEPGAVPVQVLAQIRTQAQQIGADAVILKDISRTLPSAPRLNPTTGTYETVGGQLLPAYTGIAIRYR